MRDPLIRPISCPSLAPCCSLADEFRLGSPYLCGRQPLLSLHLASLAMLYFFLQRLTIRPNSITSGPQLCFSTVAIYEWIHLPPKLEILRYHGFTCSSSLPQTTCHNFWHKLTYQQKFAYLRKIF